MASVITPLLPLREAVGVQVWCDFTGLPGGSDGRESAGSAGDLGLQDSPGARPGSDQWPVVSEGSCRLPGGAVWGRLPLRDHGLKVAKSRICHKELKLSLYLFFDTAGPCLLSSSDVVTCHWMGSYVIFLGILLSHLIEK